MKDLSGKDPQDDGQSFPSSVLETEFPSRSRAERGPGVMDLLRGLLNNTNTLVRKEIELARVEVAEKADKAARNAAWVAVGGAITYGGLIMVLAGLGVLASWGLSEAGLSLGAALTLGFVSVGLVVALIGYFWIRRAMEAFKEGELKPSKTIQTVKEDVQWAKEKLT